MGIREFIEQIPKVELHIHIEGSLEPELMFEIAERNEITLPYASVDELRQAYEFDDLQSFLDIYYAGASVLQKKEDFYDMTMWYLRTASRQNVRHVEMFFDPQTHTDRGVPIGLVIDAMHRAQLDAEESFGVSSMLIMCFLRHLSAEAAMETLEAALPYKDLIAGVGLDSSERDNPPEKFAEVFARAREEGFVAVAHAGEEGPPAYIRQALELLDVARIDHGVRCVEDSGVVAELRQRGTPLTVCPLSNVKLRVFDTMADHNLKQLMDHGLSVTVNSDDPAYFGGYVTENFLAVQEALDLDHADITQLCRNAIEASFLPAGRKQDLVAELEEFVARA